MFVLTSILLHFGVQIKTYFVSTCIVCNCTSQLPSSPTTRVFEGIKVKDFYKLFQLPMACQIKISSRMNELNTMFMTRPSSFTQIIHFNGACDHVLCCNWIVVREVKHFSFSRWQVQFGPNVSIMSWTCPKPNMFGPYFIIDNWFKILVHQTTS